MKLELQSFNAEKKKALGQIDLADSVFGVENNAGLVHQVITTHMTRSRQGTRATKNRTMVRGGGKKPWRQKGTGRARAGTSSSPIWVGGGHTFAKTPYDYSKGMKLNKKVYRLGIKCILSEQVKQGKLKVVDSLAIESHKTKDFVGLLQKFGEEKVLFITEDVNKSLYLATRNIPNVYCITPSEIDPVILYQAPVIIVTKTALEQITENLS
ncbi:MAG: 50S ribosomal protein L4 [Pseudomonadota bacterium]|nr:50S ribosomal protein L4 [Pseudomonadota bacterium]